VKDGVRGIALLFVVGEERNSAGAYAASRSHNRYSISLAIAVIIASQVFGKFEPSAMLLEREITEPLFEAVDQLQRGPASIAHQIASD